MIFFFNYFFIADCCFELSVILVEYFYFRKILNRTRTPYRAQAPMRYKSAAAGNRPHGHQPYPFFFSHIVRTSEENRPHSWAILWIVHNSKHCPSTVAHVIQMPIFIRFRRGLRTQFYDMSFHTEGKEGAAALLFTWLTNFCFFSFALAWV